MSTSSQSDGTEEKHTNPKQAFGDAKVPLHLIPGSAAAYMAMGLGEGAYWKRPKPYEPFNWRTNKVEAMTYVGAALRHLMDYVDGVDDDPDSPVQKPSLAGVLASIAILVDATETGNLIDNRPPPGTTRETLDKFEARIKAFKEKDSAGNS